MIHSANGRDFIFSSFTAFLRHSNYTTGTYRDIYIVRCVIKRTERNCRERLVKGVWFTTTFYCSLKLIFTIVDDICLQLIRSEGEAFLSWNKFLSVAVKSAETSRKRHCWIIEIIDPGALSPMTNLKQFVNKTTANWTSSNIVSR